MQLLQILAEIREYGKNTNLITRRLTGQEWNDALVLIKTHQMIELPGAVANLEDFTRFIFTAL